MAIQVGEKTKKKKKADLPENLDLFLPISAVLFAIMIIFYGTLFFLIIKLKKQKLFLKAILNKKKKRSQKKLRKKQKTTMTLLKILNFY
jgi:hypothetical protein